MGGVHYPMKIIADDRFYSDPSGVKLSLNKGGIPTKMAPILHPPRR
jgi:hypothetical protein